MLSTDLKVYASSTNGRLSATQVNTGVVQNVFPHVTSAQRTAGLTDYAKTHWKVADDSDGTLIDPEVYHDFPSLSASDYMVMCLLGQRDPISTLATTIAAADKVGTAILKNNITAGDSTLTVTVKHANLLPGGTDDIFLDGEQIKVCSHTTATATDGDEEIQTISGTPTLSGLDVTITIASTFTNSFTADGSVCRVSSLLRPSDVEASYTTPVVTSTAGTVDDTTYPFVLDHIGTIEEDLTLTWTDATHFTMSGDTEGSMGSGTVGTEFTATNADFSKPIITIPAGALGGTWVAGDTVTLTIHPATIPVGQKRVVVAGASSLANNKVTQVLAGEAA